MFWTKMKIFWRMMFTKQHWPTLTSLHEFAYADNNIRAREENGMLIWSSVRGADSELAGSYRTRRTSPWPAQTHPCSCRRSRLEEGRERMQDNYTVELAWTDGADALVADRGSADLIICSTWTFVNRTSFVWTQKHWSKYLLLCWHLFLFHANYAINLVLLRIGLTWFKKKT